MMYTNSARCFWAILRFWKGVLFLCKHIRVRCALFTAAAVIAAGLHTANALTDISPWAQSGVMAASSAGLTPDTFAKLPAKSSVSRAEFCAIALNLYEAERQTTVKRTKKVYFEDCADPDVNTAYEMKLVSGRSSQTFSPDEPVSRQDLCVILDSVREQCKVDKPKTTVSLQVFPDSDQLRGYAVSAMEAMLSSGIIKGVEASVSSDPESAGQMVTLLQPDGTATREQALIMANRFLETFDAEPLKPSDLSGAIEAVENEGQSDDKEQADASNQNLTMDKPIPVSGSVDDKKARVFGENGDSYTDQATAEANMTDITVKVWSLLSSGQKTPATRTLTVNQAIADEVKAVFAEIFDGDEQFPIKDVGGYAWRSSTKSEHRQGTAIDINYMENMECSIDEDGNILQITTGSHWLPLEDPYSIPPGGDVVRAFAAHGFAWGGDAWRSKRDFMHFSYFGT